MLIRDTAEWKKPQRVLGHERRSIAHKLLWFGTSFRELSGLTVSIAVGIIVLCLRSVMWGGDVVQCVSCICMGWVSCAGVAVRAGLLLRVFWVG